MTDNQHKSAGPKLRVGDLVEVRSAEEILLTLDDRSMLQRLPFMPDFTFGGKRKLQAIPRMRTPASSPEFGTGDLVEIRLVEEIEATLDNRGRNRGLSFTPEMREMCGRRFRVARRIHKIIDERGGRMIRLVGGCLILEGAVCRGDRHRFCPRMAHLYWRDIWLRGVQEKAPATVTEISTIVASPMPAAVSATSAARSGC